jgi:predicted chitinase
MTPVQLNNIALIKQACLNGGITNAYSVAAILSIANKESALNPTAQEVSYATTSNARIRTIFSKVKPLSEAQLTALKQNKVAFFNVVYNGIAGNNATQGYMYRGRGFIQLTGVGNYKSIGNLIGIDLVSNPDKAADPSTAAKVLVAYYKREFATGAKLGKLPQYNSTGINDFKTLPDSVGAFYHATAGWGHSKAKLQADPTGGLAKAKLFSNDMLNNVATTITNNPGKSASGFFLP